MKKILSLILGIVLLFVLAFQVHAAKPADTVSGPWVTKVEGNGVVGPYGDVTESELGWNFKMNSEHKYIGNLNIVEKDSNGMLHHFKLHVKDGYADDPSARPVLFNCDAHEVRVEAINNEGQTVAAHFRGARNSYKPNTVWYYVTNGGYITNTATQLLVSNPFYVVCGEEEVSWNLSGAVMPPPWGLSDIPYSDTASKLFVNQPNGDIKVEGLMNGLNPYTVYNVYPSNEWSTSEKWNIEGKWDLRFLWGTGIYDHEMTVTLQNMYTGDFSGTGHSIPHPGTTWDIQGTSEVVGNTITLDLIYTGSGVGYTVHAVGTIDASGAIINGIWSNASQSGTWSSLSGFATKETVGNGYPGLFSGQSAFTFMTDEYGAGSWYFNLENSDFPGPGIYNLSVWINKPGATILVSNNFEVEVE